MNPKLHILPRAICSC